MIQRIQTLFLVLSLAVLAVFLLVPDIIVEAPSFKDPMPGYSIGYMAPVFDVPYTIFFNAIFTGTAIGFTLLTIFLFKRRKIQMLLCWLSVFLMACSAAFVYFKYQIIIVEGDVVFTPWNLLLIAAALFQILAFIYIRKDEELVSSLDRLR